MYILVFYSLLLFTCIRFVGLLVSLDFYFNTKDKKFIYIILSWFFFAFAGIFPILMDNMTLLELSNLFLFLNGLFAALGSVFMVFGLFSYFLTVNKKLIVGLCISVIVISAFLYFLRGISRSFQITLIFQNTFYLLSLLGPLKWRKSFKKKIGRSIRWYYCMIMSLFIYFPISILIFLSGFNYGLYNSENEFLIIFNYLPPIITSVFIIIFLIHVEYNNNTITKIKLEDQYSHDLGNILQVISGAADIIKIDGLVEEKDTEMYELLKEKCKEASSLIKEIRKLS